MSAEASPQNENTTAIPADNPKRSAVTSRSEDGRHIGIVGDTYTILVSGKDTAGRFCLIDMFVPPGGGPLGLVKPLAVMQASMAVRSGWPPASLATLAEQACMAASRAAFLPPLLLGGAFWAPLLAA